MRLYLVRHFAPQVAPGVCYGRTDLALAPAAMAAGLAPLTAQLPPGVPVFSSPLQRCASIALALDPAATLDARLMELDFGDWEMRSWDAIARSEIDAWADDPAAYCPGGGESVTAMAARISDFYDSLTARGTAAAIVVCHAGAMRLLAARQRGMDPASMARAAAARPHAIAYGEVILLDGV